MADTKYTLTAVLEAKDSSFTSTFQRAMAQVKGLASASGGVKSAIKSIAGGAIAFSAVNKGISAVTSHIGDAVSRFDTMTNYPKIMKNLGYSADDATASITKMSDGIDGLPTALDEIAGSVTKIAPLTKSLDEATEITLAMNNALLAGGKGKMAAANALEQFSQMLAANKVDMASWRSISDAMPGQLNQIAQSLLGAGKNSQDLQEAMKEGNITFDQFNKALLKLNKEGFGKFASFEKQAQDATQGIATSFTNLGTAVTKGLTSMIETVNSTLENNGYGNIASNINKLKVVIQKSFAGMNKIIATSLITVMPYVTKFFGYFSRFKPVVTALKQEFSTIGKQMRVVFTVLAESIGNAFGGLNTDKLVGWLVDAIHWVGDEITKFNRFLLKNKEAIATFATWIPKLAAGFLAFKVVSKFVFPILGFIGALTKLGKAKGVGKALGSASKGMNNMAKSSTAFLKSAAGIFLVAAGFTMLAQSAIALTQAKGAIGVLIGLGVAFAIVAIAMNKMVEGLGFFAPSKINAIGNTFLKMGASVFLVAAGFGVLAFAAAYLASQGGAAIAVFAGMAVILAGLLVVVSTFGTGLTAAAGGMLAFGAAMLMCGAGALLASAGLYIVASVLPTITQYGLAGATAILALGGALLAFGAGAAVAGAGLLVLTAGILGLTVGLVALVAGITVFSAAMLAASAGVAVFAGAMKLVQTAVKGIAKSAKEAGTSITQMVAGVGIVKTGLASIGSMGMNAVNSVRGAFQSLRSSLPSIAQSAVSGMNSALQSGFSRAQAMAGTAAAGIVARLASASAGAFNAGAMIGAGLANGMQSQLGRVQAIAASLAVAANAAIAAKAKIGSPSRITTYYGEMEGRGFINGMKNMKSAVERTARNVFAVGQPNNKFAIPQTDNDAFYGVDPEITTILAIDGRKFAKATSRNIRNQTSIDQRRENRKVGVV